MSNPKLVVVFYGRFQPPHLGHYKVYESLAKKFGNKNVYIGTSNKIDKEKSPLPFRTKKTILSALGIPSKQIVQTKRNYNALEIESTLNIDSENSVFIVAIGEKDSQRLSGGKYFDEYKSGKELLPMNEKGYYYVLSKADSELKVSGKVLSATVIRSMLRKGKLTKQDYTFLKQAIGTNQAAADKLRKLFESYILTGGLLVEGGLGGHMFHPYDDINMTFAKLEKMISMALSGEISKDETREKTDGQNLFASIINGKIKFARNKGDVRNRGANAMDISGISKKWKDKPDVANAFTSGAKTLEATLLKLSNDDIIDIFDNGKNWLNFEVMWSTNKNVIDYDRDIIVFHHVIVIDDTGNDAGLSSSAEANLYGKIAQFNAIDKSSSVLTPPLITLKKSVDFSTKKSYFISKLSKFRSEQKIGKAATIGQWMDRFWEKKIKMVEKKLNKPLKKSVRDKVIHRLTYSDKSYKIPQMKQDIEYEPLFSGIRDLDKNQAKISKEATMPLELLFLELGAEIMKNMDTFLSANPDKTVIALRKDISKKINQIRSSSNIGDLEKMRESLRKIQAIGGFKKLVPSEGIVFKFEGKVYKLTGLFAPINQLMGIGRFGR